METHKGNVAYHGSGEGWREGGRGIEGWERGEGKREKKKKNGAASPPVVHHPRSVARILDESPVKPRQSGPPLSDQPP